MPGPLTTVARVRDIGGLYDTAPVGSLGGSFFFAHELFGYPDDPTLVARITTEIGIASAWLQTRAGGAYAGPDPLANTLFAEAEAYLALQNLFETLKCKRVVGTNFPLESEGSERYEKLIDVEMPQHIKKFVEAYLVDDETAPWAMPVMVLGQVISHTQPQTASERQQLDNIIDEATGLPVPVFPLTTEGNVR